MQSPEGGRSAIAGIWHDIQELAKGFVSLVFNSVFREANEAAHCCAAVASTNLDVSEWQLHTPEFFWGVLAIDCNLKTLKYKLVISAQKKHVLMPLPFVSVPLEASKT